MKLSRRWLRCGHIATTSSNHSGIKQHLGALAGTQFLSHLSRFSKFAELGIYGKCQIDEPTNSLTVPIAFQ